ncbi:MAG: hypothetical protein FWC75_07880 [Oscillospiraceae bacterium]|nr:hypothetical protein [Oscillospiraceae bacterium]
MIIAPGKTLLLVVGILYVVFGSGGAISAAVNIAASGYWDRTMPIASGASWSIYYTITLIGSVFYIFVGIMGISNRMRPEKASTLKVLGIIDIVYRVVITVLVSFVFSAIFSSIFGVFSPVSTAFISIITVFSAIFGLLFGLVMPVLYIIGAQKNLKAYRAAQSGEAQW